MGQPGLQWLTRKQNETLSMNKSRPLCLKQKVYQTKVLVGLLACWVGCLDIDV